MSGLERAFFGAATREQIDGWVTARAEELLGQPVAELCLRAGRIDAVYGLRLGADRVVVKVHRPPVELRALGAAVEVLGHLHATGYPCPRPIAGPVRRDGQVVTVQSYLGRGTPPDSRATPTSPRGTTGSGRSWCRPGAWSWCASASPHARRQPGALDRRAAAARAAVMGAKMAV